MVQAVRALESLVGPPFRSREPAPTSSRCAKRTRVLERAPLLGEFAFSDAMLGRVTPA